MTTSRSKTFSGHFAGDFTIGLILWFAGARIVTFASRLPNIIDMIVVASAALALWFVHAHFAHRNEFDVTARRSVGATPLRDIIHLKPISGDPATLTVALLGCVLLQIGVTVIVLKSLGPDARIPTPLAPNAQTGWIKHVVFIWAGAAMFEEFPLRGWIQGSVEQCLGPAAAIIAASLVFAVGHDLPYGGTLGFAPGVFVLGVLCGTAVYLTNSIWAAVILHAVANLIVVTMSAAIAHNYIRAALVGFRGWVIPGALIAIGAAAIIRAGLKVEWRRRAPASAA